LTVTIQKVEARASRDDPSKVYKSDLDNDAKIEIISVDPASGAGKETRVTVTRRDHTNAGSFTVPGLFKKLEIIDLNEDGYKQIAVYSRGDDGSANLVIYSFKNNEFSRVFAAGSKHGIDTDFHSALGRVRIGRQRRVTNGPSYTDIPEWDVWVWSGEKFIRE
jgi:hypothetical protein